MAYANTCLAEPLNLIIVEVNAVGKPYPIIHPAQLFHIINWPAAKMLKAVIIFIMGLAEVGMAGAIVAMGEFHRFGHQPFGNGKGCARGKRHLQHRAF